MNEKTEVKRLYIRIGIKITDKIQANKQTGKKLKRGKKLIMFVLEDKNLVFLLTNKNFDFQFSSSTTTTFVV